VIKLNACFLIFAILAACEGAATKSAQQGISEPPDKKPNSSVTIKPFTDSEEAGSSVFIVVTLKNLTDHDIEFPRLLSGADSRVEVRDENGDLQRETGFGYIHNGHLGNSQPDETRFSVKDLEDNGIGGMVKAGQATTWSLNAAKFYDMSKPGKYNIYIERVDLENPTVIIKSNTATVTVTSQTGRNSRSQPPTYDPALSYLWNLIWNPHNR
jgi:hypothetical protein